MCRFRVFASTASNSIARMLLDRLPMLLLLLSLLLDDAECRRNHHHHIHAPHQHTPHKTEPTLAARLSTKSIQFFSQIGHKIVEQELPRTNFPALTLPIEGGLGAGVVNVTELNVLAFESPRFKFQLAPPNAVQFRSQNGTVRIRGNWSASYTVALTVYASGWVEALASDVRSDMQLGLFQRDGRPQVALFTCAATIGSIDVRIGGGVIPWIVDLFHDAVSAAIRDTINRQFCRTVETLLDNNLNPKLQSLPQRLPVAGTNGSLFFDYDYSTPPIVTSDFVQQSALVDVTLGRNGSCARPGTQSPPLKLLGPPAAHMLSVWLSSQTLNCFLDSLHRSGLLRAVVDKNTDEHLLPTFLATTCHIYQLCLGRFFPTLARQHPNEHIDLVFASARPAHAWFLDADRGLNGTARFFVDFYISPSTQQKQPLARLAMDASAHVVPFLEAGNVRGSVDHIQTNFSQVYSTFGNFSARFLRTFELLMRPVIDVAAKTLAHVGLPLPVVDNITIATDPPPRVSTFGAKSAADELRLDFDLVYAKSDGDGEQQTLADGGTTPRAPDKWAAELIRFTQKLVREYNAADANVGEQQQWKKWLHHAKKWTRVLLD